MIGQILRGPRPPPLRGRGIGDALLNHLLGIFFQYTSGLPVRKAIDLPARGIRRVLGDLRMIQGQGIDNRDVAGDVFQVNGIIRRRLVEVYQAAEGKANDVARG